MDPHSKLQLTLSGALSPLEADIERVKEELSAVESHCGEAKGTWLKAQNEFISKVERKSTVRYGHDTINLFAISNGYEDEPMNMSQRFQ